MKLFTLIALSLFSIATMFPQNRLDSPEMEQVLSSEEFSDLVKSVWDVVKKGADDYQDNLISKNEFETATDFEARLHQRHIDITTTIQTFATSKKLSERFFAVLMPAKLNKYNADTQTYGVTTASKILVPPSTENISTVCPANQYVAVVETNRRGYKFAHLILNMKPEYTWHVDKETARKARYNEQNVFFKVWFKFDLNQAFVGTMGQLTVVPVKIALINKGDNLTYWSDDIVK